MSETYKKQSEIISIGNTNPNSILVNDEWTFTVPAGFEYYIESEFDGGIHGGIDLSGTIKPLVIKGLKQGTEYLFSFALEKHNDYFGNYETITDCKHDNRVADRNSGASQKIIIDDSNLYVDIIAVNAWPFGVDLQIRVRGTSIEAFNFSTMAKGIDKGDFQKISDAMKKIAESVTLSDSPSTLSTTKSTLEQTDSDCIIEGTVLVKYIGSNVDVVLPDGITEIADNTFSGRNIRSVVVPEGVISIGSRVFENCLELEEAILPSTLREMGEYSFVDCHKLKNVTLGNNLSSIEGSMFSECYELNNIVIPNEVKTIDAFAFKNCRQFTRISIPEGVQSIGFTAFFNCTNLEYLYIPSSVTDISDNFMGETPFGGCNKLIIHCPSGSTAEVYCKSHRIECVIDASPTKVSRRECEIDYRPYELSDTQRKEYYRIIAECQAQSNNEDWSISRRKLSKYNGQGKVVAIPSNVKTIASYAFQSNNTIEELYIPETVTKIENNAFCMLERVRKIVILCDITAIPNSAFIQAGQLKELLLPNTIETIGDQAFGFCYHLKVFYVPPHCKKIGKEAFELCNNLTDLFIPDSVMEFGDKFTGDGPIDDDAKLIIHTPQNSEGEQWYFRNINSSNAMDRGISNDMKYSSKRLYDSWYTSVKKKIKYNGTNKHVKMPYSMTKVDESCFSFCETIEEVSLPDSIQCIEAKAFQGCDNLKRIVLPYECETIGEEAFLYCGSLCDIYISEKVHTIGERTFDATNTSLVVHTQKGSYAEDYAIRHRIKHDNDLGCVYYNEIQRDLLFKMKKEKHDSLVRSIASHKNELYSALNSIQTVEDEIKHQAEKRLEYGQKMSKEKADKQSEYSTIELSVQQNLFMCQNKEKKLSEEMEALANKLGGTFFLAFRKKKQLNAEVVKIGEEINKVRSQIRRLEKYKQDKYEEMVQSTKQIDLQYSALCDEEQQLRDKYTSLQNHISELRELLQQEESELNIVDNHN